MLKIISSIIDTCFPPSPEAVLVRSLTENNTWQQLYTPQKIGRASAITHYGDPRVQALIKENKFHSNQKAAHILGLLLHRWLLEWSPRDTVLMIPIPLSAARECSRGYNQVERIIAQVPSASNFIVSSHILKRTRDTLPQTSLPRAERVNNMTDAFICEPEQITVSPVSRVLIIDDVMTTGATLRAAESALLPHLPSDVVVQAVALAH